MKKLLRFLFILLLLGLGFLYIVKHPDLPFCQNILKTIGLEKLTISDEPIAMGTGTFALDEIGATFTLPQGRELQSAPTTGEMEMMFTLSTPEKDNKKYPIYIRGGYSISKDPLETIQQLHNVQLTTTGQTFKVECDGIGPSACMGIYNGGNVYMIGFSATSDQPQPTDKPTEFAVPRYEQVKQAIDNMIASVVIIPMTGAELTGSELTGDIVTFKWLSFQIPTQWTAKSYVTSPCSDGSCDLKVLRIDTDAKDHSWYAVYALLKIDPLDKNFKNAGKYVDSFDNEQNVLVDQPEKKLVQLEWVSGYWTFVAKIKWDFFLIEIFDFTSEQPMPTGRDDIRLPYADSDPAVMQDIIKIIESITK